MCQHVTYVGLYSLFQCVRVEVPLRVHRHVCGLSPPHPIQMLFHCFVIKGSETWEKKLRPWFSTTAREFCDLPHFVPGVTIFNPLILFFCLIAQCIFVLWFSRPSSCFQLFQKTELMSRVCHPLMSSVFPATVDFVVGFCVYTAIVSSSFFFFF